MERVYMVCDYHDEKAASIDGAPDAGIEFLGNCSGRILREDGSEIGCHYSSTFGWLRKDLKSKLDDQSKYEIVDLIGRSVPERFQKRAPEHCGNTAGIAQHAQTAIGN